MSEFTGNQDEASCQKKLAPPRSLRDAGGKAQIVWDMIAKRYPKAAPLLCEMETAIDRAETLLQQLRRAPYDNDIGKSNPTGISYSGEFEKQHSASSVIESSSTSEETNEEVEEVGTRISYDRIPEMEDPSVSTSSASFNEGKSGESMNSTSRIPTIDELSKTKDSQMKKKSHRDESQDRTDPTNFDEKRESVRTKEAKSLEGWDKVASGETSNSKRDYVKKEITIGRQDQSNFHGKLHVHQIAKPNVSNPEETTKISEGKTSGSTIDGPLPENETVTTKKIRKTQIISSPNKRDKTTFDSSPYRNPMPNIVTVSPRMEMEKVKKKDPNKMRNGEGKHSLEDSTGKKTPLEILEDYANQIDKEVEYKVTQRKANSWKGECFFAGCTAESIADSKAGVKNEVATIILRMLAGKQMDEKDMENLTPFSDAQMRDIVALGTGGQPENAMRKLYKLCLKKNASKPIYTVKKENEVEGVKHFAECRALNEVGHGSSIRDETAKISAAEELYTKLRLENAS